MELKGTQAGVRVYDDYAHHPTEITAQLTAAREVVGRGRLVVAFQPHRYSRTLAFAEEFGRSLGLADEVVVMEVYSAGEDPVPGRPVRRSPRPCRCPPSASASSRAGRPCRRCSPDAPSRGTSC
jgi:UDP-N-acetylmuramate-alanine ligase